MPKICGFKGCNKPIFSKGLCRNHYDKLRKRVFFSLDQKLRGPYSEFKKDSGMEGENANLNELVRLGLCYVRLNKKVGKFWKEVEDLGELKDI